jgi:hypothetical protein
VGGGWAAAAPNVGVGRQLVVRAAASAVSLPALKVSPNMHMEHVPERLWPWDMCLMAQRTLWLVGHSTQLPLAGPNSIRAPMSGLQQLCFGVAA